MLNSNTEEPKATKFRCPFPWDEFGMRRGCDFHQPSGDVFKCLFISKEDYRSCEKRVKE